VLLYAAAIFFVSGRPAPTELPGGVSDKQGHLAAYGGLSVLTLRALAGGVWSGVTASRAVSAALLATAYGGSDELHQRFVPDRTADPADLAADAVGAWAGAAIVWLIARRWRRRER
jgi:VanZ family protein